MSQIRINQSLLSAIERKAIDWILPRIPSSTTPDQLTALGTLGAFVVMVGYVASNISQHFLWLANLGLALHWFGDSLDGNLARHRKIERPRYGYFIDQTIDVIGNFMICVGLGASPYVDMRVALLALAGYHMVSIYVFVRASITQDFHVSVAFFGPTELRALLILTNICILFLGVWDYHIFGITFSWCTLSVACFAAAFMITFLYKICVYAPYLRKLDDEERAKRALGA